MSPAEHIKEYYAMIYLFSHHRLQTVIWFLSLVLFDFRLESNWTLDDEVFSVVNIKLICSEVSIMSNSGMCFIYVVSCIVFHRIVTGIGLPFHGIHPRQELISPGLPECDSAFHDTTSCRECQC